MKRPPFPSTQEELETMLHKGMGRAVLYLLDKDLSQYRDLILDNCSHNYAYDQQCEQGRVEYLYPLIQRSRDQEWYRDGILQALVTSDDSWDVEQLLDFALVFGRNGDPHAREAIYSRLKRDAASTELPGADEAIELDGAQGLAAVLRAMGGQTTQPAWCFDDHIEHAVKIAGEEAVSIAIVEAAKNDGDVAAALAAMGYSPNSAVKEALGRFRNHRVATPAERYELSESTTWEEIKSRPDFTRIITTWARMASDIEFVKAAEAWEPNDDPERLRWHLRAFWKRAFPLDPAPLSQLVDHPDERVAIAALSALENLQHPAVRELFERLWQGHHLCGHCIGLLQNNYQNGDDRIIIQMLEAESDCEKLHSLSMDTRLVYEKNPLPKGVEPLLLAYEKTPCSMCRHGCVKVIQSLGPLPDWMIEECQYDADSDTRELVQELSKPSS